MREIKFRVRDRRTKAIIGYETLMPDISNDGSFRWAKSDLGTDWEDGVYDGDYYVREQFFHGAYEGDVIDVYDGNRWCICDEWEDCEHPADGTCDDHGVHKHEHPADCEKHLCTQTLKWSEQGGYFSDEDNGDFCPPLASYDIYFLVAPDEKTHRRHVL